MMTDAQLTYVSDTITNEINLLADEGYTPRQIIISLFSAATEVAVTSGMKAGEFTDWFDRVVDFSAREFKP